MTTDSETTTPEPGFWQLFLRGLNFSLFTLWGLVIGAGLSVPIVLEQYHAIWPDGLSLAGAAGLGAYLLIVAFLGTWLSLGLLGVWADRKGGRPLRLVVQVSGILLTACLTLQCAVPLVLAAMVWSGSREKKDDVWLWYVALLVLTGFVYVTGVRPGLRRARVGQIRSTRGKLVYEVIKAKEREYDAELKKRNGYLDSGISSHGAWCDFDLRWLEEHRTGGQQPLSIRVSISCSDDGVITVISRGGKKEDDFLTALETAVKERGWEVVIIRKSEAE